MKSLPRCGYLWKTKHLCDTGNLWNTADLWTSGRRETCGKRESRGKLETCGRRRIFPWLERHGMMVWSEMSREEERGARSEDKERGAKSKAGALTTQHKRPDPERILSLSQVAYKSHARIKYSEHRHLALVLYHSCIVLLVLVNCSSTSPHGVRAGG